MLAPELFEELELTAPESVRMVIGDLLVQSSVGIEGNKVFAQRVNKHQYHLLVCSEPVLAQVYIWQLTLFLEEALKGQLDGEQKEHSGDRDFPNLHLLILKN